MLRAESDGHPVGASQGCNQRQQAIHKHRSTGRIIHHASEQLLEQGSITDFWRTVRALLVETSFIKKLLWTCLAIIGSKHGVTLIFIKWSRVAVGAGIHCGYRRGVRVLATVEHFRIGHRGHRREQGHLRLAASRCQMTARDRETIRCQIMTSIDVFFDSST